MERTTPQVRPAPVDGVSPQFFGAQKEWGLYSVHGVAPKNKGLTPSAASVDPEHGIL
jgi:hypothetical protein